MGRLVSLLTVKIAQLRRGKDRCAVCALTSFKDGVRADRARAGGGLRGKPAAPRGGARRRGGARPGTAGAARERVARRRG